jgi:hypothetical protein
MQGCDASVIVASTANNTAEKDHPINLSLAGDGFDTVIRARAAVDAAARCRAQTSSPWPPGTPSRWYAYARYVYTPQASYKSGIMETEC